MLGLACTIPGDPEGEVQAGVLGLHAREIRRCLGEPTEFELEGETETWHLARRVFPDRPAAVSSVSLAFANDRLREASLERFLNAPATTPIPPGYCRITTRFNADGRVDLFEADGIDSRELNADARCMLLARSCVGAQRLSRVTQ